jgi:hypothetical protein
MIDNSSDDVAWYRQFWPWFIMFPPAAAVVAGFVTAYLAGSSPAMVVDDYGQIAMVTAQRAARDRQAGAFGLDAHLQFAAVNNDSEKNVSVRIQATEASFEPPQQLLLRLVHPTLAEMDREILLDANAGIFSGSLVRPDGRFYVQLADPQGNWRLVGELPAGKSALLLKAPLPGQASGP